MKLSFIVSTLLISQLAQASSSFCEALYVSAKVAESQLYERRPQKPLTDVEIMRHALAEHYQAKKYDLDSTKKAIQNFIEMLDPWDFFYTQAEIQKIKEMDFSDLQEVHDQIFRSKKREYFENLGGLAHERYEKVIMSFAKNIEVRRRAFQRMEKVKINPQDFYDHFNRPETEDEVLEKFLDHVALDAVSYQKFIKSSEEKDISDEVAFLFAIRKVRFKFFKFQRNMNYENLPYLIAKSYIDTLDPHSHLLLPEESNQFMKDSSGSYVGSGYSTVNDLQGLKVTEIQKGGSAERAGLKVGDIITHYAGPHVDKFIEANNIKTKKWLLIRGLDSAYVLSRLRGVEGDILGLRVLRDNQRIELNLKLIRIESKAIHIQPQLVSTSLGTVAHIHFDQFYSGVARQLKKTLQDLESKESIKALILDLRDNSGGDISEFVKILNLFVPQGVAMIQALRSGHEVLNLEEQKVWEKPLIVLTNTGSASASESLAGSLQDYGRALIVGDRQTYGKGSFQKYYSENNAVVVGVTQGLFYTPSGKSPQFYGVESDVVLRKESESQSFERELPRAIVPQKLTGLLFGVEQNMTPQREEIIAKLRKKSQKRLQEQVAGTAQENYDFNTQEAYKIAEDYIQLLLGSAKRK